MFEVYLRGIVDILCYLCYNINNDSECRYHRDERSPMARSTKRILMVVAIVIAVLACVYLWTPFRNKMYLWTTDPSNIVKGVPAQIEDYHWNKFYSKGWHYRYYLGLEQCPADVQTAKAGQVTQSFNPGIGIVNPGCVYDQVLVSRSTYESAVVGSVITFDGDIGEPMRK